MNKIRFFIGLSMLMFSCSDDDLPVVEDDASIQTLNGTWKVVSFEDRAAGTIEFKSKANSWERDIVITFDDVKDPNFVSGENIYNDFGGEFTYIGARTFTMENVAITKMGEPSWGMKFGKVLYGEHEYAINETALCIYYNDRKNSVTLGRQ